MKQSTFKSLDDFTLAYIEAMFFTESGEDNLKDADFKDISDELAQKIIADCKKFQADNADHITKDNCFYTGCSAIEYAGHDFWLTRNGHGCGFWDGDWDKSVEDILTQSAHDFGPMEVYLGDDKKVYA